MCFDLLFMRWIMGFTCRLCLFVILILPIGSFAQGFETYSQESSFATMMLECPNPKVLPPMMGFGALYSCVLGDAQTVTWSISKEPNSERVRNITLMWNDWHTNAGYKIHADLKEAQKALSFLIDMYVPERKNEIEQAFWGSKSKTLNTSNFIINYTNTPGPQKDQRLIVIERK